MRSAAPKGRSKFCARATPTALCRCCGCRKPMTIWCRSAIPRAAWPKTPPTSSCSAPAAPAWAGRRWGSLSETRMQTVAALTAVKAEGLETRIPDIFLGLTEPAKSGKTNGLRELLAAHHVPILDHHTGIGGALFGCRDIGDSSGGQCG